MDELRKDDVFQAILQLWPRCRMTKAEFGVGVWLRMRNYGADYIKDALKHHRAQYLDAIRPEWKTLFRELAGNGDGGRANDFQILLTAIRRHMKEERVPGCENMSDAEVFQKHLDANPAQAKGIRWGWREYFVDRGETPPEWLGNERC